MARKLGWLLLTVALAFPAFAAAKPGSISGYVKNSAGIPQMGAAVELFGSALAPGMVVFTDDRGFYAAAGLNPGNYQVKVSAPSFLPSLRENVVLRAGAALVVNVTLSTLFEAVQMLPPRRNSSQDGDDWKWTLRSAANRPILRMVDHAPLVVVSNPEKGEDRVLKAQVAFLAGSDAGGFGSDGDMSTAFKVEGSLFSAGTLSLNGNLAYGSSGMPASVLRAAYSHHFASGSNPELALTVRRFASPGMVPRNAALQALALSVSDNFSVADLLEFKYGGEFQSIQFMGRATAFRPYGAVDLHLSPDTVLEYRYATSQPNTRAAKGFDTAPADLSESGPRVSMTNSVAALERARHQELALSRRQGDNNFQLAIYSENIQNPALTGVGDIGAAEDDFLPDIYSGTFTYNGGSLHTNGIRAVYQRKLGGEVTATATYSYGGVLDLQNSPGWDFVRSGLHTERRHALSTKFAGTMPGWKTHWIASYKWTSGGAVTPVDMFNASPGQADPYLNVFVRQPIPACHFLPGGMEALIDVRNLLAQGYVPVVAQDGRTLYLVQSARSVRGGVAFTF